MTHSTRHSARGKPKKPNKPYADFPLFAHATGRWAKKIRGRFHYFGPWDDPDGALRRYLDQKDDLHAGRKPRGVSDGIRVDELVDRFLTTKLRKMEAGELKRWTFRDYFRTAERIVGCFGCHRRVSDLDSDDFGELRAALVKNLGPVALAKEIQQVRSIFKYGYDAGLIEHPVRFGPEFVKPSRKVLRLARQSSGERLFTAAELRRVLAIAPHPMQAMIFLGINCGWGNTDVSALGFDHLDLDQMIADFPRPKTGIPRRATLWPETVKAIEAAIAVRPDPIDPADAEAVFLTKYGRRWVRVEPARRCRCSRCRTTFKPDEPDEDGASKCPQCGRPGKITPASAGNTDAVRAQFTKLLRAAGIDRPGVSFYGLRHVFRTVADELGDRPAIDRIMGHENAGDMRVAYVEKIEYSRLKRVTDHVRKWLKPKAIGNDLNPSKAAKERSR